MKKKEAFRRLLAIAADELRLHNQEYGYVSAARLIELLAEAAAGGDPVSVLERCETQGRTDIQGHFV